MATNEGESSGVPGTEQARLGPGFRRRVVVKFKEHVQVPREDSARALERQGVGPWNALAAQFEGITLEPLLSIQPEQFLRWRSGRMRSIRPSVPPTSVLISQ
jgi:serine protease